MPSVWGGEVAPIVISEDLHVTQGVRAGDQAVAAVIGVIWRLCQQCPLRAPCTKNRTGRTAVTCRHEELLQLGYAQQDRCFK